ACTRYQLRSSSGEFRQSLCSTRSRRDITLIDTSRSLNVPYPPEVESKRAESFNPYFVATHLRTVLTAWALRIRKKESQGGNDDETGPCCRSAFVGCAG